MLELANVDKESELLKKVQHLSNVVSTLNERQEGIDQKLCAIESEINDILHNKNGGIG